MGGEGGSIDQNSGLIFGIPRRTREIIYELTCMFMSNNSDVSHHAITCTRHKRNITVIQ